MKPVKSIDVTVAFCDEGWGQHVGSISIPVGGEEAAIVRALEAAVGPLYAAAKAQRSAAVLKHEAENPKEEVPF